MTNTDGRLPGVGREVGYGAGLSVIAVAAAVSGAFMHSWARPVGIGLSIGAVVSVMYLSRQWLRSRLGMAMVALAWLAPILVFAGRRPEGDVVIQGDVPGLTLIFGGAAALGISLGMGTVASRIRRLEK